MLLVARVASAGAAGAAPASEDLAQQRFREGVEAARQERWAQARAAFEQAYQLSPRPVVLINLAGAQARTGRLVEAARNYRRLRDDTASAETAPFRKASADVLPALEARIPRVRVRRSDLGAGDTVEIDGVAVGADQLGTWQPLDPGPHALAVRRAGVERARVAFSLAEREAHELSLPVALAVPSAAHAGLSLAPRQMASTPPRARRWWASPWLWAAAAGVVGATAGVIMLSGASRDEPYSGNVPPGTVGVR